LDLSAVVRGARFALRDAARHWKFLAAPNVIMDCRVKPAMTVRKIPVLAYVSIERVDPNGIYAN
jgi:hypothetical protein